MHRAITARKAAGADLIGKLATFAGTLVRTIPGVGGAVLLCIGLGMIYFPLSFIAAGLFLLIADRRIP